MEQGCFLPWGFGNAEKRVLQLGTGMPVLSKSGMRGFRQVGTTCGTALGAPELPALQRDSRCIWLCCSLTPLCSISRVFLSIFRDRQRSGRRLVSFKAMRRRTESLHIFHPLLRVRVAWKKVFLIWHSKNSVSNTKSHKTELYYLTANPQFSRKQKCHVPISG